MIKGFFFCNFQSLIPDKSWVVTPLEKIKYDKMFLQVDGDKDGLVSGMFLDEKTFQYL